MLVYRVHRRPLRALARRGVSGAADGGAEGGGGAEGDEGDVAPAAVEEPSGRSDFAGRGEAAVPAAVCGVRVGSGDRAATGVSEEYWVPVCVRQHGDVVSVWEPGAGLQGSDGEVGVWGEFEAAELVERVVLGCEESMESVVGELSGWSGWGSKGE